MAIDLDELFKRGIDYTIYAFFSIPFLVEMTISS